MPRSDREQQADRRTAIDRLDHGRVDSDSPTSAISTPSLTFQQIQKYERGSNRIGSSRLFECAKVRDVPVPINRS